MKNSPARLRCRSRGRVLNGVAKEQQASEQSCWKKHARSMEEALTSVTELKASACGPNAEAHEVPSVNSCEHRREAVLHTKAGREGGAVRSVRLSAAQTAVSREATLEGSSPRRRAAHLLLWR